MIVLDACVWIAFLNETDSQHQKAVNIFLDVQEPILLPEYIILEVYTVLVTRVGKTEADTFLSLTADNQDVLILLTDESFFLTVIATCKEQRRPGLSFADTALVVLSSEHTIITFDRRLQKTLQLHR